MAHPRTPQRGGLAITLRSALTAGLIVGLVFGALDATFAWRAFHALPEHAVTPNHPLGVDDWLLGAAGAALLYGAVAVALLAAAGVALHAWLVRFPFGGRFRRLLGVGAAAFTFVEGFWWARANFYEGYSSTSPERLAVAGAVAVGAGVVGVLVTRLALRLPAKVWLGLQLTVMLAWLSGGAFLLAERAEAAKRGAIDESNRDLPNVLLVVVDALRPDVLGAYGNATVQTPNIDGLAAGGATFFDARVQAPYTWTSFGSFFTGKYPRRHGLMKMAPGVRMEQNLTLPQLLKSAERADGSGTLEESDYTGGAFMTGALSHGSGLAAGFDSYVEVMLGHGLVDLDSRWSLFRSELLLTKMWAKLRAKLDPDRVVNLARGWLDERRDRRFVAFVHLYSTHTPYDPPAEWRELYVDPEYDGPIQSFYAGDRRALEAGAYQDLTPADIRQIYDLYLGGVSQADHHIGLLLDDLATAGVLENTLVIVTSDHGEDFGAGAERDEAGRLLTPGRWEHSHMYRSNLHVPLVVAGPGVPRGARVTAPVESIDLLPTVADLAGLALPEPATPRDVIDGASLMPLVRGEVESLREFTFAEDARFVSIADDRYMLTLERYAVKPDGWRVVMDEGLGEVRFHDARQDPRMEKDLFEERVRRLPAEPTEQQLAWRDQVLAQVERLRAALLEWNATMPIDVEDVVLSDRDLENQELSRAEREQAVVLYNLGYLDAPPVDRSGLRERVLELRGRSAEESGDQ